MAYLYKEIVVGITAYPGTPQMSTNTFGYSGPPNDPQAPGFEPITHMYRMVGGASGADSFISFDGRTDFLRIPFVPAEALGTVNPIEIPIAARSVWARSANGVTGTLGVTLFNRQ